LDKEKKYTDKMFLNISCEYEKKIEVVDQPHGRINQPHRRIDQPHCLIFNNVSKNNIWSKVFVNFEN